MHRVAHPRSKVGEPPGSEKRRGTHREQGESKGLQGLWDCVSIYPLEYSPPVGMATAAIEIQGGTSNDASETAHEAFKLLVCYV